MMRRVLATVLMMVVAACGAPSGDAGPVTTATPTTVPTTASTTTPVEGSTTVTTAPAVEQQVVEVFFIQDGEYAKPVARVIPATADIGANTLRALLAGVSADEAEAGLSTAIPGDTLLLGLSISDGTATVDLSREFEQGGGSFGMLSRLAQVVYTITQFDTVDRVVFWLDGEPVTVFSGEGILLEDPVTRDDYQSLLPTDPPIERWDQGDVGDLSGVGSADLRKVVLVTSNDVLNVRSDAGVANPIIGSLLPGVIVETTPETRTVSGSVWQVVETPAGPGWVNARFLASVLSETEFAGDARVLGVLDEFAEIAASQGDLTSVVSRRGLYVAHNAPPIRFDVDELDTVLSDTKTYKWGSAALEPDSPELPSRTFAEAIGDRFVSTYKDTDTSILFDEVELGGNGNIAEFAIPFELTGFHFVSVYDPGDNPDFGGLDWTAWYVSIDYEDGNPVIVGLTVNEWAP
ncbi:MAG: GerMN domain-containing protein [Acidimicrobiia bacterium]|nr:GerMN domain-containing protein [Acidimicrobiia bacterium]